MSGISADKARGYLARVRALKKSHRFYDVHMHPYEILFDKLSYESDPARRGMLRIQGRNKEYAPAAVGEVEFPEPSQVAEPFDNATMQRISQMQLTRSYGHVGAPVFDDEMELSGVDRALLLPVAPAAGELGPRLRWISELYPDREKFRLAGSVSRSTEGKDLLPALRRQRQEFGISAVKCHPVVSDVDLGSAQGRGWLEMLLEGCGAESLPLVLHAGRNSPYWGGSRGEYASLMHLQEVNWSLSTAPVVLAHGGIYRCSIEEAEGHWLPVLKTMLDAHQNLYLDLSGVGIGHLKLLLGKLPIERLLFGSDALYFSQWRALATLMHAFVELGLKPEDSIVRVASENPSQVIFRE